MSTKQSPGPGTVYTFYSYKGGVGRSMAVANAGALLAKWGYSVLVVDWDLEAPGLDRFFTRSTTVPSSDGSKPGIVDLVEAQSLGNPVDWRDCLQQFTLNGSSERISLISAGRRGPDYVDRMQNLDFPVLFANNELGAYVEELRRSWVSSFDFVLIDSRTGVTDIGGICTVHLADVLILLFTSTDSSVDGGLEIVRRAREARGHIPLDRGQLLVVPLPARDESRTEYERAAQWKKIFAEKFEPLYKDWLPSESLIHDAIETLRIPYVPYWSFGERLPALEESSSDPSSLSYAYEFLARFLASKLDWNEALKGHSLIPPPQAKGRSLDDQWVGRHREIALKGLASDGYMEIYHCCVDSPIDRSQDQLLVAARQAMINTFGWPIGVVLDRELVRPRPTSEGIFVEIRRSAAYDYWTLTTKGDFYQLMSLFEDSRQPGAIFFNTRIVRTAEALLHCANLYRALGADSSATIQFRIAYGGLKNRELRAAGSRDLSLIPPVNLFEDQMNGEVVFRLDRIGAELTHLVKKLCSPLFVLFDFFSLDDAIYNELVSDFVAGKVS